MPHRPTDVTSPELTDPELLAQVREGDVAAYGTLFSRHVEAATRLARALAPSEADDLVSGAFVKVLAVLLGGGGPDVAFRAYLLTSVRRLHLDGLRATRRLAPTDDLDALDSGVPFTDPVVADFDDGAAARAFASLPERWQTVLWHLEVEQQKPAEVALLLGISPNSVSALAYRAREGLRRAFLAMHGGDPDDDACVAAHRLLAGHVRGVLSPRDSATVEEHLRGCRRCTAAALELGEVNSSLAALVAPAVLGSAALAYLTSGSATTATGVAGGLGGGLSALAGRVRDVALAHAGAAVATAAAVGVVGLATLATIGHDPAGDPSARSPSVGRVPPPAPGSPAPGSAAAAAEVPGAPRPGADVLDTRPGPRRAALALTSALQSDAQAPASSSAGRGSSGSTDTAVADAPPGQGRGAREDAREDGPAAGPRAPRDNGPEPRGPRPQPVPQPVPQPGPPGPAAPGPTTVTTTTGTTTGTTGKPGKGTATQGTTAKPSKPAKPPKPSKPSKPSKPPRQQSADDDRDRDRDRDDDYRDDREDRDDRDRDHD